MKSKVVIILLIVLVLVNIAAIHVWPFGFRTIQGFTNVKKQGFKNAKKQGFQNQPVAVGAVNSSIPIVKPIVNAPVIKGPSSVPMPPSVPTVPSQTSTPVKNSAPMLPITVPQIPATVVAGAPRLDASGHIIQGFQNVSEFQGSEYRKKEGFNNRYVDNAGGAKDLYQPMGAFDGVNLPTGNNSSVWRYTAPNEKLLGAEFTPGDDSLFMFKNNQCKPECTGSSFSCSGGGVCTTVQQRNYIAGRGGNVTLPDDNV